MSRSLRTAFDEAAELKDSDRTVFLLRLANETPELHAEVVGLLSASEAAAGFLRCVDEHLDRGERVGPFIVMGELGRGGFSVVQRARQETPVQRVVALKRLSSSASAPAVVARFEAERQTLASLSHPHIARFFDAGADALGQPWFAMELVEGVPVTRYVREKNLSKDAMIRLFLTICQAITHAHRNGIIHRDLKPSNLLVDATGHAWVIDFGIAKILEPLLPATAEITVAGQMIGTPVYMAPERFEGISDTRGDVYSLGILLGELLTGRLLRQTQTFWKMGPQVWARHLRETPPPVPGLNAELDAVLLKAIEADPALRYGSVQEFADDLLAWLNNQPVRARPHSLWYHAGKYIRRHRLAFGAGTVALLGLVIGLIFALQATAVARQGLIAAETERARAEGVIGALNVLVATANPEVSEGKPALTMVESLQRFSDSLPRIVHDHPPVEQDVRFALGEAWMGQGQWAQAKAELIKAVALEKTTGRHLGEAWQCLAIIAVRQDDYPEAARILALPEVTMVSGNLIDPLTLTSNLNLSAFVSYRNRQFAVARQQITAARNIIAREHYESTHPELAAKTWRVLAWVEQAERNFPAAEAAAEANVRLTAKADISGGAPLAEARGILAEIILKQRQDPAALQMLADTWQAFVVQYGHDHPYTLNFRLVLATHLLATGRRDEARDHAQAALASLQAHPKVDEEHMALLHHAKDLLQASE